jgi:hypothetical protein
MQAKMGDDACGGETGSASRCCDRGRERARMRDVVSAEMTAYVASGAHARPHLYRVRQ